MRLICKLISGEELEFEISKPSFIIGRSSQADIVIPHEGMSRKHCLIENKNGQFYITDLESANGVYIDEKRIPANQATPVPEYLNLSFGAVQSLIIENSDQGISIPLNPVSQVHTSPGASKKDSTGTGLKASSKKQQRTGKHDSGKKKAAPEDKSKKQVLFLVATLLVLALMGYAYYKDQKSMEAPMSPEELYE